MTNTDSSLCVSQIVSRAQRVHEFYREHNQTWNQFEQNAHVHAEVSEVWEVLRNKNKKFGDTFSNEWENQLLDEISDVIISAMTHALDLHIPSFKIEQSLERTLRKIENRTIYKK